MIQSQNINKAYGVFPVAETYPIQEVQRQKLAGSEVSAASGSVSISSGAYDILALEKAGQGIVAHAPGAELSKEQQKKLDKINAEIDKILGGNKKEVKLSAKEKKDADEIYKQINDIFADGKITKQEAKRLDELNEKQQKLFAKFEQPLSKEQQKKLDNLFQQMDKIFAAHEAEHSDINISKEDHKALGKLDKQIQKLLGENNEVKISKQDKVDMDKLQQQLDKLYSKDKLSDDDHKKAEELEKKLDKLYSKYHKPLSKEQEQKLEQLFNQMDKILAKYEPVPEGGLLG